VTSRRVVNIDVKQTRTCLWMGKAEPGFLFGLSQRGFVRQLAGFQVTAGLHPASQPFVEVQDGAPRSGHDPRAGHVNRICVLVEGVLEPFELSEDPLARLSLAIVGRLVGGHG